MDLGFTRSLLDPPPLAFGSQSQSEADEDNEEEDDDVPAPPSRLPTGLGDEDLPGPPLRTMTEMKALENAAKYPDDPAGDGEASSSVSNVTAEGVPQSN